MSAPAGKPISKTAAGPATPAAVPWRVLVTRPQADAAPLIAQLGARGIAVLAAPLLTIRPRDVAPPDLSAIQALLFTSANGVRALAGLTPRRDLPAFTVGDGSAATARALGFAAVTSADGDVESLATLVAASLSTGAGPLLHACAGNLAGDLAGRLRGLGFTVEALALYDAEPVSQLPEPARAALAEGGLNAVLLYSPRTARQFARLVREAGLERRLTGLAAICLSPAVAAALGDLPVVAAIADQPTQAALLALVQNAARTAASPHRPAAPPEASPMTEPEPIAAAPPSLPADSPAPAATPAAPPVPPPVPPLLATPDPAPDPVPPAAGTATGTGRRGGAGLVLAGAVLGMIGGAAATIAGFPVWRTWYPAPAATESSPALERRLAALESRLAAPAIPAPANASTAPGPVPPTGTDTGLAGRIAALEARPGPDSLNARLDAITAANRQATERLGGLERARADADARDRQAGERLDEISGRIGRSAEQIAAAQDKLAKLEQVGRSEDNLARRAGIALATSQLAEAARAGRAFAAPLRLLEGLVADGRSALAPVLTALQPFAGTGAPTLEMLTTRFPDAMRRAGLALIAPGQGWLDRVRRFAAGLVLIRRTDGDPADPAAAALNAAQQRLASGDLAGALQVLDGLSADARSAIADWLAAARDRLALDQALGQLSDLAVRQLGQAAPGQGTTSPPPATPAITPPTFSPPASPPSASSPPAPPAAAQ